MPDDGDNTSFQEHFLSSLPLYSTAAHVPSTTVAVGPGQSAKRQRLSPPPTPDILRQQDKVVVDHMDVSSTATRNNVAADDPGNALQSADSDASSDWDDWADAMVAQGEPSAAVAAAATAASAAGQSQEEEGKEAAEEEAWVRSMLEQGTSGSVVQDAHSRAWDYVLQMAVEGEMSADTPQASGRVERQVKGAAATEFTARWLRSNLPLALPALGALRRVAAACCLRDASGGQPSRSSCTLGRAVVDSLAEPSAITVVSRSTEQSMHRMTLFSLSANAGAAMAAAVVQPGAAGLDGYPDPSQSDSSESIEDARRDDGNTGAGSVEGFREGRRVVGAEGGRVSRCRGVVLEALDSRILEEALVAAMGRLGLGVACRSRSGVWRLRAGAILPAPQDSTLYGSVSSLTIGDAETIARSIHPPRARGTLENGSEAIVRGLIRRNPSAGLFRRGHLVAWCLCLDNGLAGALHVATYAGPSQDDVSPVVAGLLASLLGCSEPRPSSNFAEREGATPGPTDYGGLGLNLGLESARSDDPCGSEIRTRAGRLAEAIVLDDESPLTGTMQALGLERVCDADWVRLEPVANVMQLVAYADRDDDRERGGKTLPIAALATHP